MAENFTSLIREAKEALGNKRFGVGTLLQSKADLHHVLGNDFRGLVKGGECCMKFFLGKCFKEDCNFSHEPKEAPSRAVLDGMAGRFRDKLDQRVAKQATEKQEGGD
jgi:hypothetical protein